jgi:predicted small secreted protein
MTKSRLMIVLALLAALAGSSVLTACNATEGLGQDIKGAGQGLSNEAAKDK